MDIEAFRDYCLALPFSREEQPFGPDALVYKAGGKVFLILMLREPVTFNVKCEPARALELREEHPEITAGYHMNKKHWNTVALEGKLTEKQLKEQVDHSYKLIWNSLSGKARAALQTKDKP